MGLILLLVHTASSIFSECLVVLLLVTVRAFGHLTLAQARLDGFTEHRRDCLHLFRDPLHSLTKDSLHLVLLTMMGLLQVRAFSCVSSFVCLCIGLQSDHELHHLAKTAAVPRVSVSLFVAVVTSITISSSLSVSSESITAPCWGFFVLDGFPRLTGSAAGFFSGALHLGGLGGLSPRRRRERRDVPPYERVARGLAAGGAVVVFVLIITLSRHTIVGEAKEFAMSHTEKTTPVRDTDGAAIVPPHESDKHHTATAPSIPSHHRDDGGASHFHGDTESLTNTSVMTGKRKRKRKQRRPAVTEDEDLAILRAIAKLTSHRASRLVVRHRWHQVVDAVVAEIGSGVEVSRQLCQRRYDILLSQFLVQHELHKDWPENLELRQLLGEAVEERKQREEWATGEGETTPRALSHECIALGAGENLEGIDVTVRLEDDHKRLAKVEPEFVQLPPQSLKTPEVMEDLLASTPANHIPSECRSFVESTLVAVLDRLEQMEDTWLENAREERALMRQQLGLDREKSKKKASGQNGWTNPPNDKENKMPTATSNGVGLRDIDALRKEISMLTGSVTASKQAHDQLTHQVATLSTVVTDVQHDTSVLKQDATKLQNKLRDAASLAGTVKVLCGSHKQHQHQFEAYVRQQYARTDAFRRHIKQRHQRIHSQSTSLEDVSGTSDGEGQWGPSSGSESSFRLTTVYDSPSWISKWHH